MARGRLAAGALLVAASCSLRAAFVVSPGASNSASLRGVRSAATDALPTTPSQPRFSHVGWSVASAAAVGAACALGMSGRAASASSPAVSHGVSAPLAVPCIAVPGMSDENVPAVAMNTAGGRRKRLGVGGRVCMLTGKKKHKGIVRTFSEKANKRYWRPNVMWKKFWWAREKKFVRLFVSAAGIKKVDFLGLEQVCKMAGLDLYAWCLPHWMPGSRQPLALKIGYTPESRRDKMFWPDYNKKLNQGAPLSEVCSEPIRPPGKPAPWEPLRRKGLGTPPKFEVKRLVVPKMVNK